MQTFFAPHVWSWTILIGIILTKNILILFWLSVKVPTQKEKIIQDPNHMLRFCLPEYKGSKIILQIRRGGKDVIQPEDNGESSQERGVGHGGHVGTVNQGHSWNTERG